MSVTFLDNASVPTNATESWDVSEDKKGGVIAYVIPNNEDSTKYDLYIGAKDGVIANENSSNLFSYFKGVKSIEFNDNFDTSSATRMDSMFRACTNLIALDLSSFDTSMVTSMISMFSFFDLKEQKKVSSKLEKIDFGVSFITKDVTSMNDMFYGCSLLKMLDLSNFDTSNVTDMYHMFAGCESLAEINLCTFDTSKVTNMREMFGNTSKVMAIYVGPNWTTENADITNMFTNSGVSSVITGQC